MIRIPNLSLKLTTVGGSDATSEARGILQVRDNAFLRVEFRHYRIDGIQRVSLSKEGDFVVRTLMEKKIMKRLPIRSNNPPRDRILESTGVFELLVLPFVEGRDLIIDVSAEFATVEEPPRTIFLSETELFYLRFPREEASLEMTSPHVCTKELFNLVRPPGWCRNSF